MKRFSRHMEGFRTLAAMALLFCFFSSASYAGVEWVGLEQILSYDEAIVIRTNGDAYVIQKGVGCISMWRYEGRQVIISSPALFLGIGSTLILPDEEQDCHIWDSMELGDASDLEWVYLAEIVGYDEAIVVRNNGHAYLIKYGIGCISVWLYQNKYVLVSSPGLFLGIGSTLILPEERQECHVCDSTWLGDWSPPSVISAPTGISASDGANPNGIEVTWNPVLGATSYRLFRSTSPGGTKVELGLAFGPAYFDVSTVPGTTYYYWVQGMNVYSKSSLSAYDAGWRGTTTKGDLDGDGNVDVSDAILALQVLAGLEPSGPIQREADVNGDAKIGCEEVICILQKIAGSRP